MYDIIKSIGNANKIATIFYLSFVTKTLLTYTVKVNLE